jgi:threonine dehydratase
MDKQTQHDRLDVSLQDIFVARGRIRRYVRHTPLERSAALSAKVGSEVYIKLETQQRTGSFKLRGAANFLLSRTAQELEKGIVTASTGNHGKAVATMAAELQCRAFICVPTTVLPHKRAAIIDAGACVVEVGETQDEAEAHALMLAADQGLIWIPPFDHSEIIAGQGTIGLEVLLDLPQVSTVVVPLSGGGLLGGIAIALKAANPAIQLVGASMERAPVMYHSLRAGRPISMAEEPTLADSLVGGIGHDNQLTFGLINRLVDEVVTVTEEEIWRAMQHAVRVEGQLLEGGAAVALAAVLGGRLAQCGKQLVIIASGRNVDPRLLPELFAHAGEVEHANS